MTPFVAPSNVKSEQEKTADGAIKPRRLEDTQVTLGASSAILEVRILIATKTDENLNVDSTQASSVHETNVDAMGWGGSGWANPHSPSRTEQDLTSRMGSISIDGSVIDEHGSTIDDLGETLSINTYQRKAGFDIKSTYGKAPPHMQAASSTGQARSSAPSTQQTTVPARRNHPGLVKYNAFGPQGQREVLNKAPTVQSDAMSLTSSAMHSNTVNKAGWAKPVRTVSIRRLGRLPTDYCCRRLARQKSLLLAICVKKSRIKRRMSIFRTLTAVQTSAECHLPWDLRLARGVKQVFGNLTFHLCKRRRWFSLEFREGIHRQPHSASGCV